MRYFIGDLIRFNVVAEPFNSISAGVIRIWVSMVSSISGEGRC